MALRRATTEWSGQIRTQASQRGDEVIPKRTTEQRQRSLPANRQRKPTATLKAKQSLIGPDGRPDRQLWAALMHGGNTRL